MKEKNPLDCTKDWGSDVIPKEKWIDPTKRYTCNGHRVIGLQILLHNSCGEEVTYPVKGTVVIREKPYLSDYSIWTLDGLDNVVWPDSHHNLVEEPAWVDAFITLDKGVFTVWDETQATAIGTAKTRGGAIDLCLKRAMELEAERIKEYTSGGPEDVV